MAGFWGGSFVIPVRSEPVDAKPRKQKDSGSGPAPECGKVWGAASAFQFSASMKNVSTESGVAGPQLPVKETDKHVYVNRVVSFPEPIYMKFKIWRIYNRAQTAYMDVLQTIELSHSLGRTSEPYVKGYKLTAGNPMIPGSGSAIQIIGQKDWDRYLNCNWIVQPLGNGVEVGEISEGRPG